MSDELEYRKAALAMVNTHGDARVAVLLLCRVLARLNDVEAELARYREARGL